MDVPEVTIAVPLKSLITGVVNVLFVSVCVSVRVAALFSFVWSASVNTFESVAASTAALISASVWSAVALFSIALSLV